MILTVRIIRKLQLNWAEIIYVKAFGWVEYEEDGRSARELTFAEVVDLEDLPRRMDEMLKTLTPHEERVLRMRAEMMTCDEISRDLCVSRARIGQIEHKALMKLRHRSRAYNLKNGMCLCGVSHETALKLQMEGYHGDDVAKAAASDLLMALNAAEVTQIVIEQTNQVYDPDDRLSGRPALTLGDMLGLCLTDLAVYDRVLDAFSHGRQSEEWQKQNRLENAVLLADLADARRAAKKLRERDGRNWQEMIEAGSDMSDRLGDMDGELNMDAIESELIESELRMYEAELEREASMMVPSRLAKMSIDELNLTERARNCLVRGHIATVEELIQCSDRDLLRIRNMGTKSVADVKAALKMVGLTLKGDQ